MLCRGRLDGGLPGREPGADGDAAPAAAALLLRPRRRGRAHPPRPDPGRLGPPLPAPAQRRGGGDLPAPAASSAASRRPSGCRCSKSSSCRWRSTSPASRAAEADQLRQAMGSKRSAARMERLRARLYAGMAERGITGEVADTICEQLAAFANFGFPESPLGLLRLPRLCLGAGSSSTTRRRSSRRCSTPSRWASGRRRASSPMPGATGSSSCGPDVNKSAAEAHPRRLPGERRSDGGPARAGVRPPRRGGVRAPHRRRRPLREHGGPGEAGRADQTPARGARHGGGARHAHAGRSSRAHGCRSRRAHFRHLRRARWREPGRPPRGALGGRGAGRWRRPSAGHGRRGRRPGASGDDPHGGDRCGPVGDGGHP